MGHLPEREVCHMRRHIDFDKIGITDDVMFCTVLSNSEDCREFLRRILPENKDPDGWVYGAAGTARAGNPARYGMEG